MTANSVKFFKNKWLNRNYKINSDHIYNENRHWIDFAKGKTRQGNGRRKFAALAHWLAYSK